MQTILLFVIFGVAHPINVNRLREPRGIWSPQTSTVIETSIVKSYVPSSCILIEESLPPCRNVRYLSFPSIISNPFSQNNDVSNTIAEQKNENSLIQTTPGWGEFLGIYASTVTVTQTKIHTTIVEDPRIVVTFAVKGCRPLKLPLDLNKCPQQSTSALQIEEILPTSTIASFVGATSTQTLGKDNKNVNSLMGVYENNQFHEVISPSIDDGGLDSETKIVPTENLPNIS